MKKLATNIKDGVTNSVNYTITSTENRIILDTAKNPVDGIIVYFITGKGITGNVEIPMKSYNKEMALKLISEKAVKLEELLP